VEDGTRKLVGQVLAALLTTTGFVQSDAASGRLRVNDRTFELRHVYASTQPGFFDRNVEDVRVLLTDVPVSEVDRTNMSALTRMARAGMLHAVEVILNAKGDPITGALFLDGFNGMLSVSGMHRFEPASFEPKRIAGRMFTDAPRTFAGVTYQYDATFSAAIPRPPTAEETAAALASPPGRAAAAHLAAIRAGMDPFRETLTTGAVASFRGADADARFSEIRRETPPDSRVVALVTEGDDRASATVQGMRGDIVIEFTLLLRREAGVWKVHR
jgi:hypothetical protein